MRGSDMIKVGFCVAYDWPMLRNALPLIYESADRICLSIDKDRISWGGQRFDFDQAAFLAFISSIDIQKKITVFESDFHKMDLTPMQNEVRQRNSMAEYMGKGGWHIQLDADEYFLKFGSFVNYLRNSTVDNFTNVSCVLLTIFKQVEGGYLVIDPIHKSNLELIAIAARNPSYEFGRKNGYFNHLTSYKIVHQSWAREESEILKKVANWGHKNDFDINRFVEFWRSLDVTNYKEAINFHPIEPARWPALKYVKSNSMDSLLAQAGEIDISVFSKLDLVIRNSKAISRIKHAMRLLWP